MRWIIRLVGSLAVLLVLALVGVLLLPGERIARVALDQVEAQTGRAVTLEGEVTLSYFPVLGARTGAIEIANATWSDNGPLLRAEGLKIGVDLIAMIAGDIKITGLEVLSPDILMERASDGRVNWQLSVDGVSPSGQGADAAGTAAENALALSLDRALISNGRLRYLDHQTGLDQRIRDIALDLNWPVYRGTAGFDLSITPDGMAPLTAKGDIADLAALIEGQVTHVDINLAQADTTLGFDGVFGQSGAAALQAQGQITAKLPDTANSLAALGIAGVAVPRGLGQAVDLTAMLTVKGDALSLRKMMLTLDHNAISGDVDVALSGDRPFVTARLSSPALGLSALATGTDSDEASPGWSKAPIDASALGLADADIVLTSPLLTLPNLSFQDMSIRLGIDRSRAVAQLTQLRGYGGGFAGQVVANNRNGLSVGGDLRASKVDMQALLGDLIGVNRFTGRADARFAYLGVGQSLHHIMTSLSGNGAITMGRGTIEGIDLDRLMRQGITSGGTTVFDSLSATFTMENGDLNNPDLLIELPVVTAKGAGRVGLGAQDIDYLFTPQIGSLEAEGGLAIPVRIKGPWANPKVWPDLEKAVDLNLQKEKAAAREKLETRVEEELGLTREDGESLEDAAKRKLEDELLKGLGNLFKN